MTFFGLVVFTLFPVIAAHRLHEGGLRALSLCLLGAGGSITALLFVMGEVPRSGSAASPAERLLQKSTEHRS